MVSGVTDVIGLNYSGRAPNEAARLAFWMVWKVSLSAQSGQTL